MSNFAFLHRRPISAIALVGLGLAGCATPRLADNARPFDPDSAAVREVQRTYPGATDIGVNRGGAPSIHWKLRDGQFCTSIVSQEPGQWGAGHLVTAPYCRPLEP